jgi:hypothetical protein
MPRNLAARIAGLSLALLALCHLHGVAADGSGPAPAPVSTLKLQRAGDVVIGHLADPHGQPIANAPVAIEAIDVDAAAGPTERNLSLTVPANAATAIVGIRANMEGACVCAGEAAAIIGGIHYRERGTPRHADISPVSLPISGAPVSVRTLKLAADVKYEPNLQEFPVTSGAAYTLSTSLAATANAEHAGYVTIIFRDQDHKEIHRDNLWFEPSHRTLGEVTTGTDGSFRLAVPMDVAMAQETIHATFAGDASRGAAIASLALGASGNGPAPALRQPLADPHAKLIVIAPRQDFWKPFEDGATWDELARQWPKSANHVNMIALNEGPIRAMADATLARLVHELNAHHIAINLGILATNWFHEPPCGGGIEGYSDPGSANGTVTKLLRAGASIGMISMDEPLYFGHYYQGKNACRDTIEDVARRTAVIVKIYTAAFPNAIIGESEPFPAIAANPGWQADYPRWVQAFHRETGTALSFTDIDINWGDPRLSRPGGPPNVADANAIMDLSRRVAEVLRANGLGVGMFYTGFGGGSLSDETWMAQARAHMDAVARSRINPDRLIFATWDRFPANSLPESNPSALTSLLVYYLDHYRR